MHNSGLKAKTVGLVAYMQPVYGVVILHSVPDMPTFVGGAIIVAAAVYEYVREHNKAAAILTE